MNPVLTAKLRCVDDARQLSFDLIIMVMIIVIVIMIMIIIINQF